MRELKKGKLAVLVLVLLVLAGLWLQGRENHGPFEAAYVVRVVDGDTYVLEGGEKVRIIGVNTPENTKKKEPYGKEATIFAKKMLLHKRVYLEKDVSDRDRYGRLLRHVWLVESPGKGAFEEENFAGMLAAEGYAQVYTFPPDVKYEEKFLKLSRRAREERRGLWAIDVHGTTKGEDFRR